MSAVMEPQMTNPTKATTLLIFFLVSNAITAADADPQIKVKQGPLDHIVLHAEQISQADAIHVELFDTNNAKMGKAKHQDTARQLAEAAPHLLAADIVTELRESGFTNISLAATDDDQSKDHSLILSGQFTELNPGSQAVRAWIGFGAGESKVCVDASLRETTGKSLAEFSHCSKGIGWGASEAQMEADAERLGHQFALLMQNWAAGKYAE